MTGPKNYPSKSSSLKVPKDDSASWSTPFMSLHILNGNVWKKENTCGSNHYVSTSTWCIPLHLASRSNLLTRSVNYDDSVLWKMIIVFEPITSLPFIKIKSSNTCENVLKMTKTCPHHTYPPPSLILHTHVPLPPYLTLWCTDLAPHPMWYVSRAFNGEGACTSTRGGDGDREWSICGGDDDYDACWGWVGVRRWW